jgi:hypothetical protein
VPQSYVLDGLVAEVAGIRAKQGSRQACFLADTVVQTKNEIRRP